VIARRRCVPLLAVLLAGAACRLGPGAAPDAAVLAERASRLELALRQAVTDSARDPKLARWLLPTALAEISGLALDSADRLFVHSDEHGRLFEIDYRRGVLVKEFLLGERSLVADFEGLTIVGDVFYLLASNGKIYQFREGAAGARVEYTIHDTQLGRECEFEGIAYDSTISALLLACKNVSARNLRGNVVIYRWNLARDSADRLSRITIAEAQVIGANGWERFEPSDITVDPVTGNYLLIASQQQGLVEITPAGAVVRSGPLPEPVIMAEGVAITRDSLLIVSAEATAGPASISLYRRP